MTRQRILQQSLQHQAKVFAIIQRFSRSRRTLAHVIDRINRRHGRNAL